MLKILRIIVISAALLASAVTSFAADEPCFERKAECLEYIRKSAEQGKASLQYRLGWMYDKGEGVAKDYREAVRWYRKSAEQGYATSQYRLGLIYEEGKMVARDDNEAVRWYRAAAEQGDAFAQYNLGFLYYGRITGAERIDAYNYEREAYIWLLVARASGEEIASQAHAMLRIFTWKFLTPKFIRSAEREAARRFQAIENQIDRAESNNRVEPPDNNSAQKSDGEFAVAKPPEQTNAAATVFENTWRSVVMIKGSAGDGSGVIIRPNLVATNCHVVSGGNIAVYKPENKRINEKISFSAKVVHSNQAHDFCILEVKGLWGIAAIIRKYDTLKIGENVYALGAPLGLDMSLSEGVISQLRKIDKVRYIQTDAAISPGSSGGGLFDVKGNFVGMPTQKYAGRAAEGLGFAIPADLALEF